MVAHSVEIHVVVDRSLHLPCVGVEDETVFSDIVAVSVGTAPSAENHDVVVLECDHERCGSIGKVWDSESLPLTLFLVTLIVFF